MQSIFIGMAVCALLISLKFVSVNKKEDLCKEKKALLVLSWISVLASGVHHIVMLECLIIYGLDVIYCQVPLHT